jgi:hypothetical protein
MSASEPHPSPAGATVDAAAVAPEPCPACRWLSDLPLDLAWRILDLLDPNDLAACVRPVDRATARVLEGRTLVRLSRPVPHAVFAARWGDARAAQALTLRRRRQLVSLTAASGSAANLEVALQAAGTLPGAHALCAAAAAGAHGTCALLHDRGEAWSEAVSRAAAGAGQLATLGWLTEAHGCPLDDRALEAAAAGGHGHVVVFLLDRHLACWSHAAARAAALAGHEPLLAELARRQPPGASLPPDQLLPAVAHGCGLPALRAWYGRLLLEEEEEEVEDDGGGGARGGGLPGPRLRLQPLQLSPWAAVRLVTAAAASPTPDWQVRSATHACRVMGSHLPRLVCQTRARRPDYARLAVALMGEAAAPCRT